MRLGPLPSLTTPPGSPRRDTSDSSRYDSYCGIRQRSVFFAPQRITVLEPHDSRRFSSGFRCLCVAIGLGLLALMVVGYTALAGPSAAKDSQARLNAVR